MEDYLNFFDHSAFADHEEGSMCYCGRFHWNQAVEAEFKAYEATDGKSFSHNRVNHLIREGTLHGYLAYADGAVVG